MILADPPPPFPQSPEAALSFLPGPASSLPSSLAASLLSSNVVSRTSAPNHLQGWLQCVLYRKLCPAQSGLVTVESAHHSALLGAAGVESERKTAQDTVFSLSASNSC